MTESVYCMVNARVVCVDCEQEIFSLDWEPVVLLVNGEKIHAAHCGVCIQDVYTVRNERVREEPELTAILADGMDIISARDISPLDTEG